MPSADVPGWATLRPRRLPKLPQKDDNLKRTTVLLAVAALCLGLASGCSTVRNTWKDTKKLYKDYIDTDPTIDLTDEGISDPGLQKLAKLFGPVDQRLEMFIRVYYTQDSPPEAEWCEQLLRDFPWLSGVAVVNKDGTIRMQQPLIAMRQLNFESILGFEDRYTRRGLSAAVAVDDMGPLVYVGAPFFENNEYAGAIVSWFEPRNIVEASPAPAELVMLQPEAVLWPTEQSGEGAGQGFLAANWTEVLKTEVQGEIQAGGGRYVWQSRYIGQMPILYLTQAPTAQEAKAEKAQAAAIGQAAEASATEAPPQDAGVGQELPPETVTPPPSF
jgi:hypothetical protein